MLKNGLMKELKKLLSPVVSPVRTLRRGLFLAYCTGGKGRRSGTGIKLDLMVVGMLALSVLAYIFS